MARREIIGILLISVVASTLLTYHLRGGVRTYVELLDLNVPDALPPGAKSTHEFSVSLVARRKIETLVIDLDCLLNATNTEGNPTASVEEAIKTCSAMFDALGAPYTIQEIQLEDGKGTLYDFSSPFSVLAPRLATLSSTTVYCITDTESGKFAYRGVSDFFVNRNRSLASISFSKNEVPETYLTMEAGEAAAQGKPSVMEAPPLGRKEYDGILPDDRLSVRMVIKSIGVPGHSGILETLRIYSDEELRSSHGFVIPP